MAEHIYTRREGGRLEPLQEEPFSSEDEIQALIAERPELLDGEQILPDSPRRWILITREKGIPEAPGSGALWAIDHLIVDQDAVPTLVEVKRAENPEIRRTIVGQMLEYAAHASRTWTAEELRKAFEESSSADGVDPEEVLGRLLQTQGKPDADSFWQDVATNLSAKRLRLLFVADKLPDPLQRVVEFLNEQMPNIEVLAVEIKQFRGGSMQTLVPRVIGRTAKTPRRGSGSSQPRLTRESFLAGFSVHEVRTAAARLLDVAHNNGATFEWGPSGVSIRGRCRHWQQPVTVAWLYPPSKAGMGWMRTRDFSFGAGILDYDPGPQEELRSILQRWVNQFATDDFTEDASSRGVAAWSVDYNGIADHIDLLENRLGRVLSELSSL